MVCRLAVSASILLVIAYIIAGTTSAIYGLGYQLTLNSTSSPYQYSSCRYSDIFVYGAYGLYDLFIVNFSQEIYSLFTEQLKLPPKDIDYYLRMGLYIFTANFFSAYSDFFRRYIVSTDLYVGLGLASSHIYYELWAVNSTMSACSVDEWVFEPILEDLVSIEEHHLRILGMYLIHVYNWYKEVSRFRAQYDMSESMDYKIPPIAYTVYDGHTANVTFLYGRYFGADGAEDWAWIFVDYKGDLYVYTGIKSFVRVSEKKLYITDLQRSMVFAEIDLEKGVYVNEPALKHHVYGGIAEPHKIVLYLAPDGSEYVEVEGVAVDFYTEDWRRYDFAYYGDDIFSLSFYLFYSSNLKTLYLYARSRAVKTFDEHGCSLEVERPTIVVPDDVEKVNATLDDLEKVIFFLGYGIVCGRLMWNISHTCKPSEVLLPREIATLTVRVGTEVGEQPVYGVFVPVTINESAHIEGFWLFREYDELGQPFSIVDGVKAKSVGYIWSVDRGKTLDERAIEFIPADAWYLLYANVTATTIIPITTTTTATIQGGYRYTLGDVLSYAIEAIYQYWFYEKMKSTQMWAVRHIQDPASRANFLLERLGDVGRDFLNLYEKLLTLSIENWLREGEEGGTVEYYRRWTKTLMLTHCLTDLTALEPVAEDLAKVGCKHLEILGRLLVDTYRLAKLVSSFIPANVTLFEGLIEDGYDAYVVVDSNGSLYVLNRVTGSITRVSDERVYIVDPGYKKVYAIIDLADGTVTVHSDVVRHYIWSGRDKPCYMYMIADDGTKILVENVVGGYWDGSGDPSIHWSWGSASSFYNLVLYVQFLDVLNELFFDAHSYALQAFDPSRCSPSLQESYQEPYVELPVEVGSVFRSLGGLERIVFLTGYVLACSHLDWRDRIACTPDDVLLPRELIVVNEAITYDKETVERTLIPIVNATGVVTVGSESTVTGFWYVETRDPQLFYHCHCWIEWVETINVTSISVGGISIDSYEIVSIPADEWYLEHAEDTTTITITNIMLTTTPSPSQTTTTTPTTTPITSPSSSLPTPPTSMALGLSIHLIAVIVVVVIVSVALTLWMKGR